MKHDTTPESAPGRETLAVSFTGPLLMKRAFVLINGLDLKLAVPFTGPLLMKRLDTPSCFSR